MSMGQYVVKVPGSLSTGFGRKSHTNMFHGGTIFCDAESKCIHVENQFALGVGETVNSKLNFEDWLWEQAQLSIKHYHNGNWIFATLF